MPPGGISASTLKERGRSVLFGRCWKKNPFSGSASQSSVSCTLSLQESHSLRYPFKPPRSSPPPSLLTLPLQMAERGELCSRAASPSSLVQDGASSLEPKLQICPDVTTLNMKLQHKTLFSPAEGIALHVQAHFSCTPDVQLPRNSRAAQTHCQRHDLLLMRDLGLNCL